nr:cytochrome c family protein [Amylibacter marinus]
MDTMEINKIVGGVCGALLVYLMLNWVGETLYHVESGGGHGEAHASESRAPASIYQLEEAASGGEVEEGPSLEELLASADAAKGAKVFSKCKACHKLEDGVNGTGPHLFNVVDRTIAGIDGYSYSPALTGIDGTWDAAALDGFIENPKKYAPGTKMGFGGLKKATDRANLIVYLQTIK